MNNTQLKKGGLFTAAKIVSIVTLVLSIIGILVSLLGFIISLVTTLISFFANLGDGFFESLWNTGLGMITSLFALLFSVIGSCVMIIVFAVLLKKLSRARSKKDLLVISIVAIVVSAINYFNFVGIAAGILALCIQEETIGTSGSSTEYIDVTDSSKSN